MSIQDSVINVIISVFLIDSFSFHFIINLLSNDDAEIRSSKGALKCVFLLLSRSCFPRGKPFLSRCSLDLLTVPLRHFYVYLMLVSHHPHIYTRNFITLHAIQQLRKNVIRKVADASFCLFFFYSSFLLAIKYMATCNLILVVLH